MLVNLEQVMSFLPHRDPFLFVDSVESIEVNGVQAKPGDNKDLKEVINSSILPIIKRKKIILFLKGIFPIIQFFQEWFRLR